MSSELVYLLSADLATHVARIPFFCYSAAANLVWFGEIYARFR